MLYDIKLKIIYYLSLYRIACGHPMHFSCLMPGDKLFAVNVDYVMTMDTLTSVHVFITPTLTYLLTVCQHTESAHA